MEELFQDIKYYIDLRIKKVKLTVVEHLSTFCSRAITMSLFVLLLLLALLTLTGALVTAVYTWVGSLIWAFVIVGVFYILVAFILYWLRNRLFTGGMIRTFSKMFFQENKYNAEEDDYEED